MQRVARTHSKHNLKTFKSASNTDCAEPKDSDPKTHPIVQGFTTLTRNMQGHLPLQSLKFPENSLSTFHWQEGL